MRFLVTVAIALTILALSEACSDNDGCSHVPGSVCCKGRCYIGEECCAVAACPKGTCCTVSEDQWPSCCPETCCKKFNSNWCCPKNKSCGTWVGDCR